MVFVPLTLNFDNAYPAVELNTTIRISEITVTFKLFHIYIPILPSDKTLEKFSSVILFGNANGAADNSTVGFTLATNNHMTGYI